MNQTFEQFDKKVREILPQWANGTGPGCQILIRKNHNMIYEQCFGYGNLENQLPITPETTFHIASISKQFTVLAILLLQEEGRLKVDDDIRNYVGDLISFQEPVTIRQMFNNVSGIRDQWELLFMRGIKINDSISMEDVNASIRLQTTLNFPPQECYLYSNTGFHLLSVIVERVTGRPFPDFVRERIFLPLGMEHTWIRRSCSQIIPKLAYSYQDEGAGEYFYNPLTYSLYGPTSVNTCARDLVRILREYESPSLFSRETIDTMMKAAALKDGTIIEYCGGLMTHQWDGMTVYEHGGADAAYRAHLLWIPEKQLEIVLLSNTTTYLASKAAKKLAALALDLDFTEAAENISHSLPAHAGIYTSSGPDDPMVLEIVEKQNGFFMKREYTDTPLIPQPDGSYQVGHLEEFMVFGESGIRYILPARSVSLWIAGRCDASAADLKADSSASAPDGNLLLPGSYLQAETECLLDITKEQGNLWIRHSRYGAVPIYLTHDSRYIFSFNPDFVMYLKPCPQGFILDGYRARNMICTRIHLNP